MNTETMERADVADLSKRLREAREAAGMSRAKAGDASGLSPRSIEKYEYGSAEPPVSKLRMLAETYGVTPDYFLAVGEAVVSLPVESQTIDKESERLVESQPADAVKSEPTVSDVLAEMDGLREIQFEGARRRAIVMMDDINGHLSRLEPDELTALASERGVYLTDCRDGETIFGLFKEDSDIAQAECENIQARIIDTAILGVDLFAVERDALASLADDLAEYYNLQAPGIFGLAWGDQNEMVELLRPALRERAFAGNGIEFENEEKFPRRRAGAEDSQSSCHSVWNFWQE
jgi:transcriptional regulator with XRE-family HTH domain